MPQESQIRSRIKHVITFDFETFYDPADKYSLSRKDITPEEYINDERFEVIMVSIRIDDEPTYVIWNDDPEKFAAHLHSLPWDEACAIAFNGGFFDFLILGWKYGIFPFFYLDPLMMARPISPPKARNSLAALCERFGLPPKGDAVHNMAGLHLRDMTPQMRQEYAEYCVGDTDRCLEIALILLDYWTLNALAWMCIACRMSARPTLVIDRDIVERGLEEERQNTENRMQLLADRLTAKKWRPPYVEKGRKGARIKQYFTLKECLTKDGSFLDILDVLGIGERPMKWSEKQEKEVAALAKTDPIMREAIEVGHPNQDIQIALEARLGAKSTITAGRLERHKGISERLGFLPAFINPYGAHCLPGETEVLTSSGWRRLDEWDQGLIMQFDRDTKRLKMMPATVYRGPVVQEWVYTKGSGIAPMTLGHTVPYLRRDGSVGTMKAGELRNHPIVQTIDSGFLSGDGKVTDDLFRDDRGPYLAMTARSSEKRKMEDFSLIAAITGRSPGRVKKVVKNGKTDYTVTILRDGNRTFILGDKVEHKITPRKAYCATTVTGFFLARYRGKIFVTGNTGRNSGACRINIQNYPSRPGPSNPLGKRNPLRRSIKAPPGHKIIAVDERQVEVRVLGGVAGDMTLLDRYREDRDYSPYLDFGQDLFGRPLDKKKDATDYAASKEAVLACGFGLGPGAYIARCMQIGVQMTEDRAREIVYFYRETHPEVLDFWDQCDWALDCILAGKTGTFGHDGCLEVVQDAIRFPSGRLLRYKNLHWGKRPSRRFPGELEDARLFYDPLKHHNRAVYGPLVCENIVQGIAADIVQDAGVDLAFGHNLWPVLQVHDELAFVVRDEEVSQMLPVIARAMCRSPVWMPWVPLDVEADVGQNYGDMEEVPIAA